MQLRIEKVIFELEQPFTITGHTFVDTETLRVTLEHDGCRGHGESVGTYYLDETVESMMADLDRIADSINDDLSLEKIQTLLPPCGARNALDCAFWDYQAKRDGRSVWNTLLLEPRRLTTVFTISIEAIEVMAERASTATRYPHLKIKLDADKPIERLEAIRARRPDATLIIDVNQGWTFAQLKEYLPHCERLGVTMIEQPLARHADHALEGFSSPVPLGADESCLHMGEFATASQRYDVLNIKLDKCGGLTEALRLAEAAKQADMALMVGNMMGSSLSMAPSFVIGQYCAYVDIDGPLLLAGDIAHGLAYLDGGEVLAPRPELWG
ncbi:MAG: dipeptide epimerase [Congregibacter sp.]